MEDVGRYVRRIPLLRLIDETWPAFTITAQLEWDSRLDSFVAKRDVKLAKVD